MGVVWMFAMLMALLAACIIAGVFRKLRGGTFLPPPDLGGDHHVKDGSGRWWRYDVR
jgi:hypothetical protein